MRDNRRLFIHLAIAVVVAAVVTVLDVLLLYWITGLWAETDTLWMPFTLALGAGIVVCLVEWWFDWR